MKNLILANRRKNNKGGEIDDDVKEDEKRAK